MVAVVVARDSHLDKRRVQKLAPFSNLIHVTFEVNVEEFEDKIEFGVGMHDV